MRFLSEALTLLVSLEIISLPSSSVDPISLLQVDLVQHCSLSCWDISSICIQSTVSTPLQPVSKSGPLLHKAQCWTRPRRLNVHVQHGGRPSHTTYAWRPYNRPHSDIGHVSQYEAMHCFHITAQSCRLMSTTRRRARSTVIDTLTIRLAIKNITSRNIT